MIIRKFQESDQKAVEEIFVLYWTDPVFLKELSNELGAYLKEESGKERGFFVAEENGEILGVVGFKKLADYLKPFVMTDNPVELYVIAAKRRREGVGEKLKLRVLEEVLNAGFSEALMYSPHSHKESWNFHDTGGFKRVGEVIPPNDEMGQVWRKVL